MMKIGALYAFFAGVVLFGIGSCNSPAPDTQTPESPTVTVQSLAERMDFDTTGRSWFPDAKLGVFVHYMLSAQDTSLKIRWGVHHRQDAATMAKGFTASSYNPTAWAKLFKSWGATYVVLTTKHHVGFALFDSPTAQFTAAKSSPAGRDLVKEFAEAMRKEGLKVGFYYSLPDWCHPDYATITKKKGAPEKKDVRAYATEEDTVRWKNFVADMHEEIRHLLTNYGKVDLLWFDGDWERSADEWGSMKIAEMAEQLQPGVVINNRLRHIDLGHYSTPEQTVPLAPRKGWWELCLTPGDNWDYRTGSKNIKPVHELVRIYTDVLNMGGNLLINVAPDESGNIPQIQIDTLNKFGAWVTNNSEAVFGSSAGLPWGLFNGASVIKNKTLYLFAHGIPAGGEYVLKGTYNSPAQAVDVATGESLSWRFSGGFPEWGHRGWLYIRTPKKISPYANAIKIDFENDSVFFKTPAGDTLLIH